MPISEKDIAWVRETNRVVGDDGIIRPVSYRAETLRNPLTFRFVIWVKGIWNAICSIPPKETIVMHECVNGEGDYKIRLSLEMNQGKLV